MLDLELSWQAAAVASGGLALAVTAAGRRKNQRFAPAAAVGREAAILLALFALWQFAGSFTAMSSGGALGRAQWIWATERAVHLPSETAIQHAFLPHPLLVQFLNLYYAVLHFPVLIACLIWLFARHRSHYRQVRWTVVLFTAGALLIQLVPVAPPRMLPSDGMTDTAAQYGQSVYGSVAGFNADQLSAMPSVHIGWALIAALVVVQVSRRRWRWLALAYPPLTTLAVVVTANHFWLDGIVAAMLLALALLLQRAWRMLWQAATLRAGQRASSRTVFAHTDGTAPGAGPDVRQDRGFGAPETYRPRRRGAARGPDRRRPAGHGSSPVKRRARP